MYWGLQIYKKRATDEVALFYIGEIRLSSFLTSVNNLLGSLFFSLIDSSVSYILSCALSVLLNRLFRFCSGLFSGSGLLLSGLFSDNSFLNGSFFYCFNCNSVNNLFFLFVLVVASNEEACAQ